MKFFHSYTENKNEYPKDVFISLPELLKMEGIAHNLGLMAKGKRVKSILSGKHVSTLRGRGLDFEEVRNYVAGDDIRNIDWKVTARTQKTHMRVYSEEKEKPALIVLDQSKSMSFGSQSKTKAVTAAQIAAISAFRVLKEGDRVGGVVFADNGIDIIKPKRDRRNVLRFFEKIVERNHELRDSEPVDFDLALSDVFSKIRNIVTHDYLIVIISDFHRYSEKTIKNIAYLRQHNDVILVKVFDPIEREIPNEKMLFGDGTHQISVQGNQEKTQSKFLKGFNSDFANFENTMKKYRIPVLQFNTSEELETQLKNLFSRN